MLQALSTAVSGWPTGLAEFFLSLGWSQNLNHVRLDRALTPDLRNPSQLALIGQAADPFAHSADFKPAEAFNSPPVPRISLGLGSAQWGTPGRYQVNKLGLFVRRLKTFPIRGAMPAAVAPGGAVPAKTSCFTFNPLFRNVPLFHQDGSAAVTRTVFAAAPWAYFGEESDVGVRQFGVMLAVPAAPSVRVSSSGVPFSFGSASDVSLAEMRLVEPRPFQLGSAHFLINAVWQSGELAVIDPATRNIKSRLPSIEDAAKFYNQRAGVPVDKFIATSKSFSADLKVRTDQDLIMGYKIDRTPTIVVNGKYRLHVESAGGNDQLIDLVKYLVAKETK